MCGIVGTIAFRGLDDKLEKARQEAMIYLTTEILQRTQARGKDATGIATLHEDGLYTIQKKGVASPEFINRFGGHKEDYEGYLKAWRKHPSPVVASIGHCRKSSVGGSWDNVNNHPIRVGDVIGIHNGTLTNHDVVFKNLGGKRDGSVDSEAIIRLLHKYSNNGKLPFTTEMIKEVSLRLSGTFACLAMSGNNPYQVAAFRDSTTSRQVWFCLIRPMKLVVVASVKDYIEEVLFKVNKEVNLYGNPNNWPHLSKENVEFKLLTDEAAAIFNLTQEITDKTNIEDLYDYALLPRTGKLWVTHGSTTTLYGKNNAGGTANAAKKTEVKATPVAGKDDDNKPGGRIFNSTLNRYVKINPIATAETAALGVTEIEVKGENTEVIKVSEGTASTAKKDNKIENLSGAGSKEIPAVEVESNDDDTPIDVIDAVGKEKVNSEVVEVDLLDAEAAELATKAAAELPQFENDKEVMLELEMATDTVLRDLAPHQLANRVAKHAFKLGFYEGVVANKELNKDKGQSSATPDAKAEEAKKAAEKKIVQLKVMTTLLTKIINNISTKAVESSVLEKVVVEALDNKAKIDADTITSVFSMGDLRSNQVVRQLRDLVASKENR